MYITRKQCAHVHVQGFIQGGWEPGIPPPPQNFEIDKVNNQCNEMQIICELLWLFVDQASILVLPWERSFCDGDSGRGFIRFVQADYRYTCINGTRKITCARSSMTLMFEYDNVLIKHNIQYTWQVSRKAHMITIMTMAL